MVGAAIALSLAACVSQAARSYSFTMRALPGTSITDAVVRVFGDEKLPLRKVDPAGKVESRFVWTGIQYGFLSDRTPATLVKRYIAVLSPRFAELTVTLRGELFRCGGPGGAEVDVLKVCEEVKAIGSRDQDEIDRIGQKLQRALRKQ